MHHISKSAWVWEGVRAALHRKGFHTVLFLLFCSFGQRRRRKKEEISLQTKIFRLAVTAEKLKGKLYTFIDLFLIQKFFFFLQMPETSPIPKTEIISQLIQKVSISLFSSLPLSLSQTSCSNFFSRYQVFEKINRNQRNNVPNLQANLL
jgi:hypothetical protein